MADDGDDAPDLVLDPPLPPEDDDSADRRADDPIRPRRPPVPDEGRGSAIIAASWAGTIGYSVLAVGATVALDTFRTALIVVSSLLLLAGFVFGLLAYVIAVLRSRDDAIGMGGLFFLAGTAPRRVQVHLMGSLAVEVVVSIVTASIGFAVVPADSNNVLAVGTLVPLYGLGLAGLWGARHGRFDPRAPAPPKAPDPTG